MHAATARDDADDDPARSDPDVGPGAGRPGAEPVIDRHLDDRWRDRALVDDVRDGLDSHPRRLAPRWLYDDRGSELFDRITRLPEYYLTEAERSLLSDVAPAIVEVSGADTMVELGAGTSDKTRTLLDAMVAAGRLRRFVPLDVSEQTLRDAALDLAGRYDGLEVHAVVGDFVEHFHLVPHVGVPLVVFLGSTIGNLEPAARADFLRGVAEWLPAEGHVLLGVDLIKPLDRIMAAYNDSAGLTAEFSLNVLRVLNRELDADFDPEAFEYVGLWDPAYTRVDLRLRSRCDQRVRIPGAGIELDLAAGEEIRTEVSTKFTLAGIADELSAAGLQSAASWTSAGDEVALVLARRS